jgi:hypothetical protein
MSGIGQRSARLTGGGSFALSTSLRLLRRVAPHRGSSLCRRRGTGASPSKITVPSRPRPGPPSHPSRRPPSGGCCTRLLTRTSRRPPRASPSRPTTPRRRSERGPRSATTPTRPRTRSLAPRSRCWTRSGGASALTASWRSRMSGGSGDGTTSRDRGHDQVQGVRVPPARPVRVLRRAGGHHRPHRSA